VKPVSLQELADHRGNAELFVVVAQVVDNLPVIFGEFGDVLKFGKRSTMS
jgi:hypothetical protein